ncbi:RHS repeat-associated core domain-containing protein [Dactylosporangium sp. CA-092794]|uniref:RHS repeat-associated core domain-containing protein n=1 Tax=Dactylosporangium sp. CA-092794 TaxID=3239929 RepID=UPI003D8F22FD
MAEYFGRGFGRGVTYALALVLAVTLVDLVTPPKPAQAAPAGKPACPADRVDRVSAVMAARLCGGKVEVSGEKSETLQMWANPDGSLTAEQHAGPVRMRDGKGGWKPVDFALQADADGSVSAKAHPRGLKLSGAAGDGEHDVVTLGSGDDAVGLVWPGRLPRPAVDGTRATYTDVLDGVDLVIESTRTGYEQFFVVKTREALSRSGKLTLRLKAPRLTVTPDGAGGLLFEGKDGKDAGRIPAPSMWDASVGAQSLDHLRVGSVGLSAVQRGANITLELAPDPQFLASPDLTFPITIDPTIYPTFDTFVQTGWVDDQSGSTDLKLGYSDDGGTWTARSFLTWNTAFLAGAQVNSATVYLWNYHSWSCTAASWEVWDTDFVSTATRWTNQPTWKAKYGTSTQTKGFSSSCNDGWVSAPATGFFQIGSTYSVLTMGLRATNETDHLSWKRFHSSEGANPPYAVVTFNGTPQVTARSTDPSTECVTGGGRPFINKTQPKLRAQVTDPEGSPVSATFEWSGTGGTVLGSTTVGPQASGSTFEATIPSGAIGNNGTYRWRVRGTDGSTTGAYSSYCEFAVDTAAPGTQPGVSSSTFPENTWTGQLAGYTTSTVSTPYVAGTTTLALTGDDAVQQISLPFPASFYGQSYSSAWIDTNGMVSFVDPHGSHPDDIVQLPNSADPNAAIYVFGQDLIVDGSASVRTATSGTSPNRTFLIEWNNASQFADQTRRQNAEVLFTENSGTIKLNYSGIDNAYEQGSGALAGVEDADGTSATQFSYHTASLNNDTAVIFTYSAGTPAVYAGTAASFTFSAGGTSDIASYLYDLDIPTPGASVAAASLGGNATVSVTPSSDGAHTLYVQAVDRAGNKSPVRSYQFNVGSGSITAPTVGTVAATTTLLQATGPATATGATFQWRRADTDVWATIPAADVTYTSGGGAVIWPVAKTAALTPSLNWNVKATLGGATALAGPLQVRAAFSGTAGTPSFTTPGLRFTLDPDRADAESTEIGPGSVNLLTGAYNVSNVDVNVASYGTNLSLSRGFNSRQAGVFDTTHMFGPGWTSTATAADAPYSGLTVTGSLVQVKVPDGSTIGFTAASASAFTPEAGKETLSLTYNSGTDAYTLSENDGDVVVFRRMAGGPTGQYTVSSVTTPGNGQTSAMSWETVTVDGATVTRPTQILAPVPSGVSCATLVRGCRALTFTYATATTATGTAQAGWGDYTGRVKQVSLTAWDPATAAMKNVAVAAYSYDSNGRLTAQWDPRLDNSATHLWTTYAYNTDGTIATVTPIAQQPWTLGYTIVPGDAGAGRLASVSRSALSSGTAVTTVVYNVPVSGSGAPYDLSAGQIARWAQTTPAVTATAVFDPGQVPGGNQTTGVLPTSWTRATVTYLDANGRRINLATPGGNIDTTWYDDFGNISRTLSATNRASALAASATDTVTEEAALARTKSNLSVYSADGRRLTTVLGPMHHVRLASGVSKDAREVTLTTYDEGIPAGTPAHNFATTVVTGLRYWDTDGTQHDADLETTKTVYDWSLLQPLQVIVDPAGLALRTSTAYDAATGLVTSTTQPAGGTSTNTPATTITVYYSTAANGTYAECGGHPEWAGLACRTQPGGQPASGPQLPYTVTTYDLLDQPATLTEKISSGTLRTTTTTYDGAGRISTVAVTAAIGSPVPTRRYVYDPATGQVVNVQTLNGATVTAQSTTSYDTLGRVTSYTDAAGNVTTTGYDLHSRISTVSDGLGTRTYTYDQNGENRGLLTQVADSQAGTFTGAYDANGALVTESWPNSLGVTHQRDERGSEVAVTYTRTGCGQADCTLFMQSAEPGANGLLSGQVSTLSAQDFGYDAGQRLTTVKDTVNGECTTRTYGFNTATDRSGQNVYGPGAGGACQATTAASSRTWTYDTASRVTGGGYVYDALGRSTTVPAADTLTPGAGDMTVGYYVNDLEASLAQNEVTNSFALDVTGGRVASWTDGTTTHVNHYADGDQDMPAWTDEGGGVSTRPILGVGGVTALATSAGGATDVVWQPQDLAGNLVISVVGTDVTPSLTSETTEYGATRNPTLIGTIRYAWQGGALRAADQPAGIVLMGVRLYNPTTGRFLSVDPVAGGSANAYDYCKGRPVGCSDVTGRATGDCMSWKWFKIIWKPCGRVTNRRNHSIFIAEYPNGNGSTPRLRPGQTSTGIFRDVDSLYDPVDWMRVNSTWYRPRRWVNIHGTHLTLRPWWEQEIFGRCPCRGRFGPAW